MVRVFPLYQSEAPNGLPFLHTSFKAQDASSPPSLNQTSMANMLCRKVNVDGSGSIFYGSNPLSYSFPLMLLEISFLLIVIHTVRFILKPLRQPKIVAEIIGGIIVGPSVLGRNKKFSSFMFPTNSDFMIKNIGIIGFMFFLFVSGVKMDMSLITKTGKKHVGIALISVLIPLSLVLTVGFLLRNTMVDMNLASISTIGAIGSSVVITAFPVLYPILKELNLLSSEIGRMALTVSIVVDAIGLNSMIAFESSKQTEEQSKNAHWFLASLIFVLFLIFCTRKLMMWVISRTPEGKSVDQTYVIMILLGVFMIGFLTDMFGLAIGNGPMWMGLVIPDGPPLGSTIVDKCETIMSELLMPFAYAHIGLFTDVTAVNFDWLTLKPLVAMMLTGYIFKFLGTLLGALCYRMSLKDGLTLSLISSLRGQIEYLLFMHWIDKEMIDQHHFSCLVILTTMVTAITTPLISILYDPTKPYMVNKRRSIQHTPQGSDLRLLLVVFNQETVGGLINLVEASNPTINTPFSITALCLLELVGRAAPVVIDHEKQKDHVPSKYSSCLTIHNALKLYKESRVESVKIHSYTTVTIKKTMYQDICERALLNKASFIILPFSSELLGATGGTERARLGDKSVNSHVLSHAPCSVGIFVDKGHLRNPLISTSFRQNEHRYAVLFLGGADSREALCLADRMLGNVDVFVIVIRFLSFNGEGDDEMEKKLDDGAVTWFWMKNESNERVIYREVVVRNGAETVAAIQAMNDESYDLWIVGRGLGVNPVLLEGLLDWTENHHELGIVGDYVTSVDFGGTASVLVMQQQILREQNTNNKSSLLKKVSFVGF